MTRRPSRRAYGITVTRAAMQKAAIRHARLTLLAAAHAALNARDDTARADARTAMADCHAALDDLRGVTE